MALIECVPNFSEGRDEKTIGAIVAAIRAADVHLLDVSSDVDHNRTVVTFAGEPNAVLAGAYNGIKAAAANIDLTKHAGVHPRIGAADVVPLIPLRGISLAECAALARELAQRVGAELNLPVFLYEAAALQAGRTNLADIRRGGYEKLQARMDTDPNMKPDYGAAQLGKAGAVVIGAREPLIAYNAYLNTDNVQIAKRIASAVRASSGGLPHLKALGLLVDGRAQVSMNVVDYRQTSLFDVMQAVDAQAAEHGVQVTETELIGLVPQAALLDAALAYLRLPLHTRAQILEQRVGAATNDYREIPFE